MHSIPLHIVDAVSPLIVALIYIAANSLFKEPQRRNFRLITDLSTTICACMPDASP